MGRLAFMLHIFNRLIMRFAENSPKLGKKPTIYEEVKVSGMDNYFKNISVYSIIKPVPPCRLGSDGFIM